MNTPKTPAPITGYRRQPDTHSWNVVEIRTPEGGAPRDGKATYHANLGQAAVTMLDKCIKAKVGSELDTAKILRAVQQAEANVLAAVKLVGK